MDINSVTKTERKYWEEIEGLGGCIWQIRHDLSHGHLSDTDGGITKELLEFQTALDQLVAEVCDKFGVIHPKDYPKVGPDQKMPLPPKGKVYYWNWYNKNKKQYYKEIYGGMICSACPFSKGLKSMIFSGGSVPCKAINGWLRGLRKPHECGMVSYRDWNTEKLHEEIVKKGGDKSLLKFQQKEQELKEKVNS